MIEETSGPSIKASESTRLEIMKTQMATDMPYTSSFQKAIPDVKHHGYLLVKNDNNEWEERYCILDKQQKLKIYSSHQSPPSAALTEHLLDVDSIEGKLVHELMNSRPSTNSGCFTLRVKASSRSFRFCAPNMVTRDSWITAIVGRDEKNDRASTLMKKGDLNAPFVAHFGHITKSGFLEKKTRYTSRWIKEWFVLVDSELHYYNTNYDPPHAPRGTIYICYHSGKSFPISLSSKRPQSFTIQNPNRTYYLAAENEMILQSWLNAIESNVKRISMSTAQRRGSAPGRS